MSRWSRSTQERSSLSPHLEASTETQLPSSLVGGTNGPGTTSQLMGARCSPRLESERHNTGCLCDSIGRQEHKREVSFPLWPGGSQQMRFQLSGLFRCRQPSRPFLTRAGPMDRLRGLVADGAIKEDIRQARRSLSSKGRRRPDTKRFEPCRTVSATTCSVCLRGCCQRLRSEDCIFTARCGQQGSLGST
jgi:hypothetical protein